MHVPGHTVASYKTHSFPLCSKPRSRTGEKDTNEESNSVLVSLVVLLVAVWVLTVATFTHSQDTTASTSGQLAASRQIDPAEAE